MVRRAAKRDIVEPAVIAALEAVGAQVEQLDSPVDLLVRYRHRLYLMEVKSTKYRDKRQKAQKEFCELWGVPYVENAEDALAVIGVTTWKKLVVKHGTSSITENLPQ